MGAILQEYRIEYTLKLLISDTPARKEDPFYIRADSFEDAARTAQPELIRIGFGAGLKDIWDATIINSKGEQRDILKSGGWLIDNEGKLKTLEGRV